MTEQPDEHKTQAQLRKEAKTPPKRTRLDRFAQSLVERVLGLSRLTRVILSGIFALAVILVIRPIIDLIYLDYIYIHYPETNALPAWLAAIIGIVMYGVGWRLIVGVPGETMSVRRSVFYYLFIGIGSLVVVVALTIHGLITAGIEL